MAKDVSNLPEPSTLHGQIARSSVAKIMKPKVCQPCRPFLPSATHGQSQGVFLNRSRAAETEVHRALSRSPHPGR